MPLGKRIARRLSRLRTGGNLRSTHKAKRETHAMQNPEQRKGQSGRRMLSKAGSKRLPSQLRLWIMTAL